MKINLISGLENVFAAVRRTGCSLYVLHSHSHVTKAQMLFISHDETPRLTLAILQNEKVLHMKKSVKTCPSATKCHCHPFCFPNARQKAYINIINIMRNYICCSKLAPVRDRLHKRVAIPFELVCSSEAWKK